jgi:hypothetical protein
VLRTTTIFVQHNILYAIADLTCDFTPLQFGPTSRTKRAPKTTRWLRALLS